MEKATRFKRCVMTDPSTVLRGEYGGVQALDHIDIAGRISAVQRWFEFSLLP
jgi:hypothetical protein